MQPKEGRLFRRNDKATRNLPCTTNYKIKFLALMLTTERNRIAMTKKWLEAGTYIHDYLKQFYRSSTTQDALNQLTGGYMQVQENNNRIHSFNVENLVQIEFQNVISEIKRIGGELNRLDIALNVIERVGHTIGGAHIPYALTSLSSCIATLPIEGDNHVIQ